MRKFNKYLISTLILLVVIYIASCSKSEPVLLSNTVTDVEGNVYHTLKIGNQTWMAENLRTTKYRDSTLIPNVTNNSEWFTTVTGAYCNGNNSIIFGKLYNWYAINTGKLAPRGWHVATDADWTKLTTLLGGEGLAGGKLKESGTAHWLNPNIGATNDSIFSALPGGNRDSTFHSVGNSGYWWSATEFNSTKAWFRIMNHESTGVGRYPTGNKAFGFSVRCVKDSI